MLAEFAKFAMVAYIFSFVLLAVALIMFNSLGVELYASGTITGDSIQTLIGENDVSTEPNASFIFGDFIAGLQALGGIIYSSATGGTVGEALYSVPFFSVDYSVVYLFQGIYTFSAACLILYLLTGRS